MTKFNVGKKHKFNWNGDTYYLLGIDESGVKHYVQRGTFDCKWYWGGVYINTFTDNKDPEMSDDIDSHSHFDTMFREKNVLEYFKSTPLSKDEMYKFWELAESFYTLRNMADMSYVGGAHVTENPLQEELKNKDIYEHCNRLIEKVYAEMDKLLSLPDSQEELKGCEVFE